MYSVLIHTFGIDWFIVQDRDLIPTLKSFFPRKGLLLCTSVLYYIRYLNSCCMWYLVPYSWAREQFRVVVGLACKRCLWWVETCNLHHPWLWIYLKFLVLGYSSLSAHVCKYVRDGFLFLPHRWRLSSLTVSFTMDLWTECPNATISHAWPHCWIWLCQRI